MLVFAMTLQKFWNMKILSRSGMLKGTEGVLISKAIIFYFAGV